ncbi:glycosyltransferase family 2 protein [Lactiplantibacillus plantarum]|uniref:glycosyltransferase family 2 protein n=1 Tax=Lactiplantibacillus plantarum TaxID=1590 RepID=UPI001E4FB133|nr:glycosyltransferase family 2 protein [Lactiplantibacillus plantarum]
MSNPVTHPIVSIIVPVYNVSGYLEECVNSLIDQSFTNIEIILVDDGSTDNSGKLCDRFALLDDRINVIHQKNHGLSGARNTGIRVAHVVN